ncbi:MAG TPA: PadR family transcriptional regulator [Jatrophihabitans sp.]|nr:PadR family transcriptional regulator [Jatrophihabitans sp.]
MVAGLLKNNVDLMLMGVLRRGPAHGYAIIAALREHSDGGFDLAEGTIYPALHRLERAGLIESSLESAQGRRRRTYALTARGRKEFATQRRAWQSYVANMQAVIA